MDFSRLLSGHLTCQWKKNNCAHTIYLLNNIKHTIYLLNNINIYIYIYIFEGSLEVKLPTIWTDEKQSREEAERRERSEERRVEEKE